MSILTAIMMHDSVATAAPSAPVASSVVGADIVDPSATGGNDALETQLPGVLSSWASSRTFTQRALRTVVYSYASNQAPISNVEKARLAAVSRDVCTFWEDWFAAYGLGPANGLPEVRFDYNDVVDEVLQGSLTLDASPTGSCPAWNYISPDILAIKGYGSLSQYPHDILVFGFSNFGADPALADIPVFASETDPGIASLPATTRIAKVNGFFYANNKVAWSQPISNHEKYVAYYEAAADALAAGPFADGDRILIRGRGGWQNLTGGPSAFDFDTWLCIYVESKFIACGGGVMAATNATPATGIDAGTFTVKTAVLAHEHGHSMGLGHSQIASGNSVMSGSTAAANGVSMAQAIRAYMNDIAIGTSNNASDNIVPTWTLSDTVAVDRGPGTSPVYKGRIQTSNQADVPVGFVIALVDWTGGASFNDYSQRSDIGAIVNADGTFALDLTPYTNSQTGPFKLTSLVFYNLARKSKTFSPTNPLSWTL